MIMIGSIVLLLDSCLI